MSCLHFFAKNQILTNTTQNLKLHQDKQTSLLSDREQIIDVIEIFFESGKTKDLTKLKEIQLDDSSFSSFSDVPPYDLKDFATTVMLEELKFVSISDYDYKITNPKISVFGDTAVAAFELNQKGMLVDNKAFTGQHISINGRATFVLVKKPTWKIVHIHLSKIKDY
jgi:hypothetical protein